MLAEAGYPNGFKTKLLNRAVKLPYIDYGVYLITAWKKIGIEAEHNLEESATWGKNRRTRDFEVLLDPMGTSAVADPDELLVGLPPGHPVTRPPQPSGNRQLFAQQKVEIDDQKRIQLVKELQKELMKRPGGYLACGGPAPKCGRRASATTNRTPTTG